MNKEKRTANEISTAYKVKTVIGVILCVILIPILIFNLTLIIKSYVKPNEVPGIGGKFPLIVMSDSMYPVFETGDLLICKSVDTDALKEGDIITYYIENNDPENDFTVVAHRITAIETDEDGQLIFTTQGDANSVEDPSKVKAEDIFGIYDTHIKGLGRVAMFMQTTQGLILCVLLPIVILVGIDILRRRRYEKASETGTAELMAELEELRALKEKQDRDKETDK